MARTAITPTAVPAEGSVAPSPTTIDATLVTNGAYIPNAGKADRWIIHVKNTNAAAKNLTVPAGDNPPAHRAGMGALVVSVPATTGERLISVSSGQHAQEGTAATDSGTIHLDFETGMTGSIEVYEAPKGGA